GPRASEAPLSVSAQHRPAKPLPRTLTAIAEIAAVLATGDSVSAVMPGILGAVASELDGTQASLWLRGLDGLRRAWSVASDETSGAAVDEQLRTLGQADGDDFVVARLRAGHQELGALSVRPGRALAAEDRLFVATVSDLLGPALRDAEYANRLESEVATRTR